MYPFHHLRHYLFTRQLLCMAFEHLVGPTLHERIVTPEVQTADACRVHTTRLPPTLPKNTPQIFLNNLISLLEYPEMFLKFNSCSGMFSKFYFFICLYFWLHSK